MYLFSLAKFKISNTVVSPASFISYTLYNKGKRRTSYSEKSAKQIYTFWPAKWSNAVSLVSYFSRTRAPWNTLARDFSFPSLDRIIDVSPCPSQRALKLRTGFGTIKAADDTCTQQPMRRADFCIVPRVLRSQITTNLWKGSATVSYLISVVGWTERGKTSSHREVIDGGRIVTSQEQTPAMRRTLRLCFALQLCVLLAAQKTPLDSPENLLLYRSIRDLLFGAFGTCSVGVVIMHLREKIVY